MRTIILSVLTGLWSFSALAQPNDSDQKAIEKQVEAFTNSWNKHDFSDLKNYTTPDLDWVNVVGMYWNGRKEVEFAHQTFHNEMFKKTPLKNNWIKIKFITPDAAVAHVSTRAGAYMTPSGYNVPEQDNIALMVFVKQRGQWLLTSCENVNVDDKAKASDPVLHMPR